MLADEIDILGNLRRVWLEASGYADCRPVGYWNGLAIIYCEDSEIALRAKAETDQVVSKLAALDPRITGLVFMMID